MIYFQRKEINMSGLLSMIGMQTEWESALDRLNVWFKDASLKIKKL